MTEGNKIQKGTILSELAFYKVEKIIDSKNPEDKGVIVTNMSLGVDGIFLNDKYVENMLTIADSYTKEEELTQTELSELVVKYPRVAMTVCFVKKDQNKKVADYNAEKKAKVDSIVKVLETTPLNQLEKEMTKIVDDLTNNPISKTVPGDLRVMKGYYESFKMNDLGRLPFYDLEEATIVEKQIDPRTIKYVIVKGVKYNLKTK